VGCHGNMSLKLFSLSKTTNMLVAKQCMNRQPSDTGSDEPLFCYHIPVLKLNYYLYIFVLDVAAKEWMMMLEKLTHL
jgi:hypothetical protein